MKESCPLTMKYLLTIITIISIILYCIPNTYKVQSEEFKKEQLIESLSTKYKVDYKLVNKIITCESSMYSSAVNENISSTTGKVWSRDWGLLQINDYYHEKVMSKIGLDIHNEYDSLEYGIMLLSKVGTSPWKASSKCWLK